MVAKQKKLDEGAIAASPPVEPRGVDTESAAAAERALLAEAKRGPAFVDDPPLCHAARHGRHAIARALLAAGAALEAQNSAGGTAIFL